MACVTFSNYTSFTLPFLNLENSKENSGNHYLRKRIDIVLDIVFNKVSIENVNLLSKEWLLLK